MAARSATNEPGPEARVIEIDIESIPDDALRAAARELKRAALLVIEEKRLLQHRLERELRARYGPSSERSALLEPAAKGQTLLFPEEAAPPSPSGSPSSRPESATPKPARAHQGRRPIAASVPRRRVLLDLDESERECPCCRKPMQKIGEETAERVEYDPARLFVIEEVRPKYACTRCQEGVLTAPPTPLPIEKGLAGPSLLAHVAVSKFADHLPLYRQELMLKRSGVEIPRSTLCDWIAGTADRLEPIVAVMRVELLKSFAVHTDDTTVPVLEPGEKKTHKSRLWTYVGDRAHRHIVYEYTRTREGQWPLRFLGGFRGHLHADDYAGYEELYRRGVREVACWAHVRRKFFDARETDPPRCEWMIETIRDLYAIEREVHDATPEARAAARRERSRPILEKIRAFLDEQSRAVLPKSPTGGAIAYALKLWPALLRFVDDGRLEIDNNRAERALRGVVIGRKNWLFAGSDEGGRRAAIIYSVIATCKEHGVEPFEYLRDVLTRIPTFRGDPATLTPPAWKRAREAAASTATALRS